MKTAEVHCLELCPEEIRHFKKQFDRNPRYRVAMNAITRTTVRQVAMNRAAVVRNNHTFSHVVKAGAATSQNSSGRCWMFAALNLFRMSAAERMNLEDFELSQNYLFFWDKLERANFFLEGIFRTLNEPADSRLLSWLVSGPVQDGGQWDMFANLVDKYGLVPKECMPETESSSNTGMMNDRVTLKLRECAARIREAHSRGESIEKLRARKPEMLSEVYRMLCMHLGEPPARIRWQWRDKDKEFHREGLITPQQFRQKFVSSDLDTMVCLIHCPMRSTPFNKLYTIPFLGNVVGGRPTRYLNVALDVMKKAAVDAVKDGMPVWFGCDVGKMFDRDLGMMDTDLYEYESLYGVTFELDKAARLDYGASSMSHAMVLTGVDVEDGGHPAKWRVENSWGDKPGDKGFMVMTDGWFDEYTYEVLVDRKYLPKKTLKVLETPAVELPPWHPMGALAAR